MSYEVNIRITADEGITVSPSGDEREEGPHPLPLEQLPSRRLASETARRPHPEPPERLGAGAGRQPGPAAAPVPTSLSELPGR
jgi:hypothetical protein